MKQLLENWRKYVNEITSLENKITQGFKQAIVDSEFWTHPHTEDEVDEVDIASEAGTKLGTPATEVLMNTLNEAAESLGTELYFAITTTGDINYTLAPDDPYGNYPNNWLMHGKYTGPQNGLHVIWIEFRPVHDDFDVSELEVSKFVNTISRLINHEMVHYQQLKKQAASKGISEEEAWEELLCDPKQIPVDDPVEWRKRCGKEPPKQDPGRGTYLTRHGEIDAYAYEAAEQLLDRYGPEEAIDAIRNMTPVNLDKYPEISSVVRDYATVLKSDSKELNKFRKKLYQQIQKHRLTLELAQYKKSKLFK